MTTIPQVPGLHPKYEDYVRCVHCGLCLNHCPTYRLWHLEADSPRGRIRQMIHVENGEAPVNPTFVEHIDKCLDCRACETACPSGVEYGKLVEYARARIASEYRRPIGSRWLRRLAYRRLLPYPGRISLLGRVLRFYQTSGLQNLMRRSGVLAAFRLAERERLLPLIDKEFFFKRIGRTFPAEGERRARVAFFGGCIANVTFTSLNDATIRVLTANGCEVIVPAGQLCCGALASHAGERNTARLTARKNLEVFLGDEFDAIVTNAAGCGSTLKEYSHLFSAVEPEHELAVKFEAKVRDTTEFLADLGLSVELPPLPLRATYQDSCHLLHGQRVREAPRNLLRAIPELDFVELPGADICCGSAGVYNITQPQASMDLLRDKMKHAKATAAQVIATANPGCLLQLRAGAEIYGTGQEVLHVIELLDRALRKPAET